MDVFAKNSSRYPQAQPQPHPEISILQTHCLNTEEEGGWGVWPWHGGFVLAPSVIVSESDWINIAIDLSNPGRLYGQQVIEKSLSSRTDRSL